VGDVTLHPETTPDPAVLTWVVAPVRVAGVLDSDRGDPLPAGLAGLFSDGVLGRVRVLPGRVTTTLADGRDWATDGARVRSAIHADLAADEPWPERPAVDEPAAGAGGDEPVSRGADLAVAEGVRELLDGPVGAVAAAHGGSIRLVDVHDGVVDVELHGACHGCPAAENTLGRRIEAELRTRYPEVRSVRQVDAHGRGVPVGGAAPGDAASTGGGRGRTFLGATLRRRR